MSDRIAALRSMLERNPSDARALFGLAIEHEKRGEWAETASSLQRYLDLSEDQGNAWGRLGHALRQLGRNDEARAAYRRGIEEAYRHGHPSMAGEFEELIEEL